MAEPTPFPITPAPGTTAAAGDIVGRDGWILRALSALRAGNNLVIADPRRMGKTAVLIRLCNEPGSGMVAIKVDYEGAESADDFLTRTISRLSEHQTIGKRARDVAASFFDTVEISGGATGIKVKAAFAHRDRADLLREVVLSIAKNLDDEILVIAMDEVPLALNNIAASDPAAAHLVLQALRSARQEPDTNVRWILTGSVGFHHVLRRADTTEGVVGDLVHLDLGPLDHDNAVFLAKCLLLGVGALPDDSLATEMAECTGGIPFLLHLLAHEVRHQQEWTVAGLQSAFTTLIRDRGTSTAMTHFLSRIDDYYGDDTDPAYLVLDEVARHPNGRSSADLRAALDGFAHASSTNDYLRLTNFLLDDHYLVKVNDTWRWRYEVLRQIWMDRRDL